MIEVIEQLDFPDLADLPEEDGVPLESPWHRIQINLLADVTKYRLRGRRDYFAGANMFVYFSRQQLRNRDYKGPDFFLVWDVDGSDSRDKWVVWEEGGRYPNVIIELLSPSTADEDLGKKKDLYERVFQTANYFCYDPGQQKLWGWRIEGSRYVALKPDKNGRLWSEELEAWLGIWQGMYQGEEAIWLRLFDEDKQLLPTEGEGERQRAETEHQRAEAERERADTAEAEIARLQAELARLKQS